MSEPFVCDNCGELFSVAVWHCRFCDHHWPLTREECHNCYGGTNFLLVAAKEDA